MRVGKKEMGIEKSRPVHLKQKSPDPTKHSWIEAFALFLN